VSERVNDPDHEYMTAAVARIPDADAACIECGESTGIAHGIPAVSDLLPGVDLLSGLAISGTEIMVIEEECSKTSLRPPNDVYAGGKDVILRWRREKND